MRKYGGLFTTLSALLTMVWKGLESPLDKSNATSAATFGVAIEVHWRGPYELFGVPATIFVPGAQTLTQSPYVENEAIPSVEVDAQTDNTH